MASRLIDQQHPVITAQGTHDAPLGGTGTHYIDTHQDGSVSVHWSVRLIDYNMYTGEVLTEAPSFNFGRLI